MSSETVATEFKPKMTHDEFITQLREAGFTEKTLAALDEEDINSDAALRILSVRVVKLYDERLYRGKQ